MQPTRMTVWPRDTVLWHNRPAALPSVLRTRCNRSLCWAFRRVLGIPKYTEANECKLSLQLIDHEVEKTGKWFDIFSPCNRLVKCTVIISRSDIFVYHYERAYCFPQPKVQQQMPSGTHFRQLQQKRSKAAAQFPKCSWLRFWKEIIFKKVKVLKIKRNIHMRFQKMWMMYQLLWKTKKIIGRYWWA